MAFNDRDYTRDALITQLGLVELHTRDGSALDAGCQCIETKHLYIIEGLANEGVSFALNPKEAKFMQDIGNVARSLRKALETEDFDSFAFQKVGSKAHKPTCNAAVKACMAHGHTERECRAALLCS